MFCFHYPELQTAAPQARSPWPEPGQRAPALEQAADLRLDNKENAMANRTWLGCLIAIVLIIVVIVVPAIGTYNRLVALDQAVQAQWGQVQNVYQRRADLIPNLVATVKGVANFEKSTYIAVAQARAKVGQVQVPSPQAITADQGALSQYQAAQDSLTSALSRLLVVVERYPELKANENFLALQSQLEGTENRVAVERMRYNEAAQAFNTVRQSFPTVLYANFFGDRFKPKAYFQAQPGAENAPKVQF
ncbi:MAG TPA: LemA family protein [Candidatus Eremiobacteraceae bacterium]|nr:LemA family protein [Candidatus Eremiobacteraceae bacterium]